MFRQRLITSLILIPAVLLVLFYANNWLLGGIVILISVLTAKECWQLIPLNKMSAKAAFVLCILLGIWVCYYWLPYWLTIGFILWVLICVAIISFPKSQPYWGHPIFVAASFLILLPLFAQSFIHVYLLPQGKSLIVYLLFLVWAADIGAYLFGKGWGHTQLIPKVSPGKSWEGVAGGFVCALLVAVLGLVYFTPFSYFRWLIWAALTVVWSIIGDLFISILKRRCHLKDTGTIIYGHGGILDRLDSLIAATPVFYLGLTYIPLGI